MRQLVLFFKALRDSVRDLLPIIAVIAFFQLAVLKQPIPDIANMLIGLLLVVLGLTFFVRGLELGLFPIGETMAHAFARKGSLFWLLMFAFALGFGTTVAEPAVIAVTQKAADAAQQAAVIANEQSALEAYQWGLRVSIGLAVGSALVLGVLRILKGWPTHLLLIGLYLLMVALTSFTPPEVVAIAYDSGAVTTSEVTVPLVAALGVGLSSVIQGRNPLLDGFGLVAFASVTPIIFVMVYGILS